MANPRKRKHVSYKEPLTDPSDRHSYKSSTSRFNYIEKDSLRITINKTDSLDSIVGVISAPDMPDSARDLCCLEGFNEEQIKIFDPRDHQSMSETSLSFLVKLRLVLENNARVNDIPREERFIDDMAIELLKAVKYDNGKDLTMRPCSLRLVVGDRSFAAEAYREGRKGLDVIWVMQENKHIDDTRYSEGDVQLAACMIAAFQANYRNKGYLYPDKVVGIKVKGDEVHLYCLTLTEEYLHSLARGPPSLPAVVIKYPSRKGLRISDPKDRVRLLADLWKVRKYAVDLSC